MEPTETFATKVLSDGRFKIDIVSILAIIEVIATLIQNCSQSQESIIKTARSPSMYQKARLRLAIRRCCSSVPNLRWQTNDLSDRLVAAAASATDEELAAVIDECQSM